MFSFTQGTPKRSWSPATRVVVVTQVIEAKSKLRAADYNERLKCSINASGLTRALTERIDLFQQKNVCPKGNLPWGSAQPTCGPEENWIYILGESNQLCWQVISQETRLIKTFIEGPGSKVVLRRVGLREVFEPIVGWYQMLNLEDYIFKIYGAVFGHYDLDLLQSPLYYLPESIWTTCVPTCLSPCILSRLIPVALERAWITSRDWLSHFPTQFSTVVRQPDCGPWSPYCFTHWI